MKRSVMSTFLKAEVYARYDQPMAQRSRASISQRNAGEYLSAVLCGGFTIQLRLDRLCETPSKLVLSPPKETRMLGCYGEGELKSPLYPIMQKNVDPWELVSDD